MRLATLACLAVLAGSTFAYAQPQKTSGEGAEAIFKRQCQGCHGADAKGQTAMGKTFKLKDLTSEDVQKQTDSQLFDAIAKGKGKMPAYENNLGKDRIESLVKYLRELAKK